MIRKKIEQIEEISCPQCGGTSIYNIVKQKMYCEYCGTYVGFNVQEKIEIKSYSLSDKNFRKNRQWGEEIRIARCKSCNGETNIPVNEIAKFCNFCGSSNVVITDEKEKRFKPENLITFTIEEEKCKKIFKKWIKFKWLAPNSLRRHINCDKVQGVYLPFWSFDMKVKCCYKGEISNKSTYDLIPTSNIFEKEYSDFLVVATDSHRADIIKRIKDYEMDKLVPYKNEYLSGFRAERYSVDLKKSWEYAQGYVNETLEEDIRKKYKPKIVVFEEKDTSIENVMFKYVLLPIWISTYTYKGIRYEIIINGQTGKISGDYPYSSWKISFLILLGLLSPILTLFFLVLLGG